MPIFFRILFLLLLFFIFTSTDSRAYSDGENLFPNLCDSLEVCSQDVQISQLLPKLKTNPVCEQNLLQVQVEPRSRIFAGDLTRTLDFSRSMFGYDESLRINAIKSWLIEDVWQNRYSYEGINVERFKKGRQNQGMYEITVSRAAHESKFILKVSQSPADSESLERIEKSVLSHPECFEASNGLKYLPKFPKLIKAAQFPHYRRRDYAAFGQVIPEGLELDDLYYLTLMSKVSASPILSLKDSDDLTYDRALFAVGRSLAAVHMATTPDLNLPFRLWTPVAHNDLHGNNVLYDIDRDEITWIDTAHMKRIEKPLEVQMADQITAQTTEQTLSQKSNRKGLGFDFFQAGSKYIQDKYVWEYLQLVLDSLVQQRVKNPSIFAMRKQQMKYVNEVISFIGSGEVFNMSTGFKATVGWLQTDFKTFKILSEGYLSALPLQKQLEADQFFREHMR